MGSFGASASVAFGASAGASAGGAAAGGGGADGAAPAAAGGALPAPSAGATPGTSCGPATPGTSEAAGTFAPAPGAAAGASGSGAAGAAGAASPPPPPGMEIAGRSTRETTSATWLGNSFKPGRTVSENCQMPTPSIAAAIITPASEDLDSRMSSVWKALPPPRDISWASWSSPASRQAPAGSRRNRARKLGSASNRSISRAATSASVGEVAIAYLTPRNRCQSGLPNTNTTGRKNTSQSVPMTPYTTGAGTSRSSRKIVL